MTDLPEAVMVFAAGFGTRMRPLTDDRPKPLIEVAGRPLLDHALDLTGDAGRVVVNTHYLGDQIAAHLAGRNIALSHEQPEILDTGGGLRNALPALGPGPVITLNSDAVWTGPNPLETLRAAWDPSRMEALLLLIRPEDARGHSRKGDFLRDPNGRLTRGPGLIYSGTQIIRTDRLADVKEAAFSLNVLWDMMSAEGTLYGTVHTGGWCDVGTPAGISEAEEMLAEASSV